MRVGIPGGIAQLMLAQAYEPVLPGSRAVMFYSRWMMSTRLTSSCGAAPGPSAIAIRSMPGGAFRVNEPYVPTDHHTYDSDKLSMT